MVFCGLGKNESSSVKGISQSDKNILILNCINFVVYGYSVSPTCTQLMVALALMYSNSMTRAAAHCTDNPVCETLTKTYTIKLYIHDQRKHFLNL